MQPSACHCCPTHLLGPSFCHLREAELPKTLSYLFPTVWFSLNCPIAVPSVPQT